MNWMLISFHMSLPALRASGAQGRRMIHFGYPKFWELANVGRNITQSANHLLPGNPTPFDYKVRSICSGFKESPVLTFRTFRK